MKTNLLFLCLLSPCAADVAAQCVASTPIQPVIAPGVCKPGYVLQYGVAGEECYDNFSREEDIAALSAGLVRNRDARGNVQSVRTFDRTTGAIVEHVAEFGDFDAFGRPGWYFDATGIKVDLQWPPNGACLPSAITTRGWTANLTWADAERVASIAIPQRKQLYAFNYYPDGALHMVTSETTLYDSKLQSIRAYSEQGVQIGYNQHYLPIAPTTSAALAASAAQPSPPEPFFRPKVIARPAVAGGPIGPQLLGVQTLLLPVFDMLAQQTWRFFASSIPTEQTRMADCAKRLYGEYAQCEAAVSDSLGARPWPPEVEAAKQDCDLSARERHRFCLAGEIAIAPPLRLPPLPGSKAQHDCARAAWQQYRNDTATCEGQFPQGGAQLVECYQRALDKYNGTLAACKGK